jgi:hypothetical protein
MSKRGRCIQIRITLSRVIIHGVNVQWQYMGIVTRYHAKRVYLNRTHLVVL